MTDEGKVLATAEAEFSLCVDTKVSISVEMLCDPMVGSELQVALNVAVPGIHVQLHNIAHDIKDGLKDGRFKDYLEEDLLSLMNSRFESEYTLLFIEERIKVTVRAEFGETVVPHSTIKAVVCRWLHAVVDHIESRQIEITEYVPATATSIEAFQPVDPASIILGGGSFMHPN